MKVLKMFLYDFFILWFYVNVNLCRSLSLALRLRCHQGEEQEQALRSQEVCLGPQQGRARVQRT